MACTVAIVTTTLASWASKRARHCQTRLSKLSKPAQKVQRRWRAAGQYRRQQDADPSHWFDCAVLDEHASQSFSQDWWSGAFKDAIQTIG
eukprot:SAG22_NODE_792_length_7198_cov_1.752641_8_plen_89_part_01